MSERKWIVVDEVAGDAQAEVLRGLLEANGIQVWLSQEGAGHLGYAVGVGRLARVEILVPSDVELQARELLEDYYAGRLEGPGGSVDEDQAASGGDEEMNAEEGE